MVTLNLSGRILYEDNHLIAVNKLAGELSQGDETGDPPLGEMVKQYIKKKYAKPGDVFLGIVHRLDRPVSGVMLFARTSKALIRLTSMLREKRIEKTYWAVVKSKPPQLSGELVHYLQREKRMNITQAFTRARRESRESQLTYHLIKSSGKFHLLEIIPHTGRQHQIRAQLAAIGCPIVGDVKYGYPQPLPDASIALHARKLDFIHPVKKIPVTIAAPLPENKIWNVFAGDRNKA